MNFLKRLIFLFTSLFKSSVPGRWVVTDTGAKIWDDEPLPDEVVKWSGAMDEKGYATGTGVLQFIQDGKVGITFEGQMLKGKYSGKGIFKFANGDNYEGDFVEGAFCGKGIFKWIETGNYYEGDFVNDTCSGKGVFHWASGSYYEGDFINNEHTGKGIYRWANGDYYEGDFVNGKYSGKGMFHWADGDWYEGEFVNDQRSGKGIYQWVNGDRYEGDFENGKRTGKGIFRWADGNCYEGDFINNKRTGKGIYRWADGDYYEGDFVNGQRTGKGIMKWAESGNYYEGDFIDGDRTGRGISFFPDGESYAGEFLKDRYHGMGIYKWADGDVYEGEFADNEPNGKGIFRFNDGSYYEGDFIQGEYHGEGILRYVDGSYFEGGFIEGEIYGFGTLYSRDGTILMQGQWVNGEYLASAQAPQDGASYQIMQLEDAIEQYNLRKEFIYRIDAYEEFSHAVVRVYKGDINMEGNMDLLDLFSLQGVAGIIVEGDLTINGSLVDFSNRSLASFLLVTGNLRANNILAGRSVINIQGNTVADNVIIGHSSNGSMYIKGNLQAKLLIVQNYFMHVRGQIDAVAMTDCDSKQYVRQDYKSWRDILTYEAAEELLDRYGALKRGKEVLHKIAKEAPIFRNCLKAKLTSAAVGGDAEKGKFVSWAELKKYIEGCRNIVGEPLFGFRDDEVLDDEVFLLFEGNTVFEEMDLDAREFAVLINGNLIVKGNITNSNTDGATSLIVLGDLHTRNIAVGGQLFYVTGNLTADEILCGSYNHGYMYAGGDVRARLILSDDYSFSFQGTVTGQLFNALDEGDLTKLMKVLDDNIFEDDANELIFNFHTLQETLVAGKSALIRACGA